MSPSDFLHSLGYLAFGIAAIIAAIRKKGRQVESRSPAPRTMIGSREIRSDASWQLGRTMKRPSGNSRLVGVPQPVIQRWMQQRMGRKFRAIARAYMRWKLPRREKKRRRELEATFEITRRFAQKNEGGSFPAFSTLLNIGLYLLVAERDIQSVKIDALTHPDEWTRKLSARIILLTIYEWDADKVCGRALKDALDLIDPPEELRTEALAALKALRLVQRKARSEFAFVRNAAIAHRDPNALVQCRAIRDLKIKNVLAVAEEFYLGVHLYMAAMTKLLRISSSLNALIRQWQSSRTTPSS